MKRTTCFLAILLLALASCGEKEPGKIDDPIITPTGGYINLKDKTQATISVKAPETSVDIAFHSDEGWTASTDADWISLSGTSGMSGDQTVTVTIDKNSGLVKREATLRFACALSKRFFKVTIYQEAPTLEWVLDFEDNFDTFNTKDWLRYDGGGHNNNGRRDPNSFSVKDGLLVVTASDKDYKGTVMVHSGGMAHSRSYLPPARFEFKVRTEDDPSRCTSGVILTWPTDEMFPEHGENDIYETGTGYPRTSWTTFIHYSKNNQQKQFQHKADAREWHTMAMDWFDDLMIIYRDGEEVWRLTDTNVIPHWKHHLCIQLDAFKKSLEGNPDTHMYVDWVRIYKLAE